MTTNTPSNIELWHIVWNLSAGWLITEEQKSALLEILDNTTNINNTKTQEISDLIQAIQEWPLDDKLVKSINAAGSAVAKKDKDAREALAETTRNLVKIKSTIITYLQNRIANL